MRIAIVGKMRAGKNTVADILTMQYGFKQIAFADGITEIIEKYFPEALEKGKPRKHYQHIGQQLRELNPKVWINYLDRRVNELNCTDIAVTDCRQVNEANYLRDKNYLIIKVEADDEVRKQRIIEAGDVFDPELFEHDTEKQVDKIVADIVVLNNGTHDELVKQVKLAYLMEVRKYANK